MNSATDIANSAPDMSGAEGGKKRVNYEAPPRTFREAIVVCLRKYAAFRGRASRSEFWWFYLFLSICGGVASVLGNVFLFEYGHQDTLHLVVDWVLVLPWLSAAARRLHDTSRSAWLLVLAVPLVLMLLLSADMWLWLYGRVFGNNITGILLFVAGPSIALFLLLAQRGSARENRYDR